MKKTDEVSWGMLWQSRKENEPIEDTLKMAVEHFLNKYFTLPEMIYVNREIKLRVYGNIPVWVDNQMFHAGLVTLMIPKNVEVKNR